MTRFACVECYFYLLTLNFLIVQDSNSEGYDTVKYISLQYDVLKIRAIEEKHMSNHK